MMGNTTTPARRCLRSRAWMHDRVIYTGSFSKVLYPGLALAYLVAPAPLVQACGQAAATGSNGCSKLVQAIVADFMAEGHFSRHLKKMRQLYGRRRRLLAAALRQVFGDGAEIGLAQGGMHLIVRLPEYGDDAAQARRAQAAGLNAQPLSARYAGKRRGRDCCWDSRIWPPRMRHYCVYAS